MDSSGIVAGVLRPTTGDAYAASGTTRALAASYIYWTRPGGSIESANLDGTYVNNTFPPDSARHGIAVDANHLYWASYPGIARANLDGSGVDPTFIDDAPVAGQLAVDANHVYWTAGNYQAADDAIGRADLDGTDAAQSFITVPGRLSGIAVDAPPKSDSPPDASPPNTTPPQTKITKGARKRTEKTNLGFRFISSEPDSSFECRLDKGTFKPCTSPKKLRRIDAGKHRFRVRGIDAAGNVDPSAATDRFRVLG